MEYLPINDLPNELLEVIFDHLDVDDLKDASLVCKRWSDLAISGRRMDRVLKIGWGDNLLQSNLKYRHLEIVYETAKICVCVKKLFQVVNLSSLRIKDFYLSQSSLRLILLEAPNLQHLAIRYECREVSKWIEPFPVMKKLERLEIQDARSKNAIHWHTIAPSLQSLKMYCDFERQLEQWTLFSGQLKQAYVSFSTDYVLNGFCQITFPLLEELSVKLEHIFDRYEACVQRHDLFLRYEFFRRNTSFRLLRLYGIYLSKTIVQDITNHCKKLTALEIRNGKTYYCEEGSLESLSQLTELKHLRLERLQSYIFSGCQALTSLQSLSILFISFDIYRGTLGFLEDLIKIAPQLRCLELGSVAIGERTVQYICDNFLKLTRLQLTYSEKEAHDCLSRIGRLLHLRYLDLKLIGVQNTFFKGIAPQNTVPHLTLHLHTDIDCNIEHFFHRDCNDDVLRLPEFFPQLKTLNLNSSCEYLRKTTIDRLRELIPSCVVILYGELVSNRKRKFGRQWPRDRMTPAWEKEWKWKMDRI